MKYIRIFDTYQNYQNYRKQADFIEPNLSLCEDSNEVHFNKYTPKIVAKFNITDTSSTTIISASGIDNLAGVSFKQMEVDGVVLDTPVANYQFATTGEHIVRYALNTDTEITINAFARCNEMTEVTIPDTFEHIGPMAFINCGNLASVILPNNLTQIESNVFKNNTSLTSIDIPDTVTTIQSAAFLGCTSLTSITIPNGVEYISINLCAGCTGLTDVTLGSGAIRIQNGAFDSASNVESFTVLATTPPVVENITALPLAAIASGKCTIYVPAESVETYKTTGTWADNNIKDHIQAIPTA